MDSYTSSSRLPKRIQASKTVLCSYSFMSSNISAVIQHGREYVETQPRRVVSEVCFHILNSRQQVATRQLIFQSRYCTCMSHSQDVCTRHQPTPELRFSLFCANQLRHFEVQRIHLGESLRLLLVTPYDTMPIKILVKSDIRLCVNVCSPSQVIG